MAEQDRFLVESRPVFTPFWRRLPRFFLYPLQAGPIMRIGGYSLVGGIAMFIPVLGLLLWFILWLVFLKDAFVVMERTANGRFDAPDTWDDGDLLQVVRLIALMVVLVIVLVPLIIFLGHLGKGLAWLLINIVPPAGIMIIAATRSVGQALNPERILFYVKTIGTPYLALCFILASVTGSAAWMQNFIATHMDSWLVLPLVNLVEFYFMLIAFHMMGYAIYQYHEALGIYADVSFEEAQAQISPDKGADPFLVKLSALVAEGKEGEAISLLREQLRTNWERNDLHERYQKLLVAAGKRDLALSHARDFIGKLVLEKRLFQALDLCEQSLKADGEFQLQNSDHVYDLASAARLAKRYKLALDLMRRFDKRYPGHKHIPAIYLLSAQILSEHYRMNSEAMKILRTLHAKFPDHALAGEARQYLVVLTKMEAVG